MQTAGACRSAPTPPVRAWLRMTSGSFDADSETGNCASMLACLPNFGSGLFPGLCDGFHGARDILIDDMGIAQGALDVAMVHRLLHELEVAAVAQELGPEIMPVVVEAEILDACSLPQPLPRRLGPGDRQWVALAAQPPEPLVAVLRDVGEDEFGMLALQREQDFADGISDRKHHAPAALSYPHNLARAKVHLRPS